MGGGAQFFGGFDGGGWVEGRWGWGFFLLFMVYVCTLVVR